MATNNKQALSKMAQGLKCAACFQALIFSSHAWAIPVNGELPIDASTPVQSYEIGPKGELTATNATTLAIKSSTGGQLDLTNTIVNSGVGRAIELIGSKANINGSTLIGRTYGLFLGYETRLLIGSSVQVNGGSITAVNTGALVSALSTLSLNGTDVLATGANSSGLEVSGTGIAKAYSSTITGQGNAIRFRSDTTVPGTSNLHLDNTHVTGVAGSAIVVGIGSSPSQAKIHIGNLIEVSSTSTADVTVDNSHLTGDVGS